MISEELILDASEAERTIAQIDQQLQQAAELFKVALADALDVLAQPVIAQVEADTTPAETEIAALSDAPPVDVPVAADTEEAEQGILALGDAPPVDVPVSADTAEAEQLILALGDQPPIDLIVDVDDEQAKAEIAALASSAPPVDLLVEADTQGAQQSIEELGATATTSSEGVNALEGSTTALGAAAGVAEGSARELLGAVGELGGESSKAAAGGVAVLAVATAGFFEEGLNAVSAGQRFNLILGDMAEEAEHININGLDTSIEDLGLRFGSTGSEMQNATAKLVQFSVNSGASKEQAIQFAHQIETLSARAIALNPQLGTLGDVTDSLGSKIGRGGRFAAQYGLDLNGAEIATRALADTGKGAASDLTFVEKAMAGAEIASEKYGSTLAGTVADGEENAAIQAESLKASFKEAIEQIGVPLVAPVLDLIRQAEPDAVLIAQDLGTLAKDALPAVAAGLSAIDPPLRLISGILEAIPTPIIAGAIAFWGFRAALNAVAGILPAVIAESEALETTIPLIAAASAIAVGAMVLFGDSNAETQKHVADLTAELTDQDGVLRITTADLTEYLEKSSDIGKDPAMVEALNRAGLSFSDLAGFAEQGEEGLKRFIQILESAGVLDKEVSRIGDATTYASGEMGHLAGTTEVAGERFRTTGGAGNDLVRTFQDLQTTSQASAEQQLQTAIASKKLTDQQVQEAEARHKASDGTTDYIGTINELTPLIEANTTATENLGEQDQATAQKQADLKAAMDELAAANPAVAMTMAAVSTAVGDQGASLVGLAVALSNANLSTEQLDVVAQQLGVTTQSLQGFVKDVTGELDNFVSTAVSKLPDVSAAIDNALDPESRKDKPIIIDPAKLEGELQHSIDAINGFNFNVQALVDMGFENLAKVAAERGPEFTAGLVQSINKGGADMGATLDAKFGELNALTAGEPDRLRTAGMGIITATGDVAADASKNFGDKFQLSAPTQAQIDQAHLIAELANVPFSEALASVAGNAAVAYEQALGAVPPATTGALQSAQGEIDGWAHAYAAPAGAGAGGQVASGFSAGMGPLTSSASQIISDAAGPISRAAFALRPIAFTEGFYIGQNLSHGISAGIDSYIGAIEASAREAVRRAASAARAEANAHSPSRLFMDLGKDIAEGLAKGMDDNAALADEAGRRLIASAISASPGIAAPGLSLMAPTRAGVSAGEGHGDGLYIGNVSIVLDAAASASPSAARVAGVAAADAFAERLGPLAERRLLVSTRVSG